MSFSMGGYTVVDVTIASGGTASGAVDTLGYTWLAVEVPAAVTGTALAIHGCRTSDGTFVAVHDSGGAVSESMTVSTIMIYGEVAIPRYIKLVSNGAEAAARAFKVYLKA